MGLTHFINMKKILYIYLIFVSICAVAQPTHFSDTLKYTPLEPYEPYGGFIFPLQDGSLKIAQINTSLGLYLLKTDINYNYQNYKVFNISDTMVATLNSNRFADLPSGNHIAAIWLRNATQNTWYNCFMKLNADMSDTVSTHTFLHTYNNTVGTSSTLGILKSTKDSTSFWAIGDYYIPGVYRTPTYVARMDTNFNVIAQHNVVFPSLYFGVYGALPRANNRCIINGVATTSLTTAADNIGIAAVNDTGTVWRKIMGSMMGSGIGMLFGGILNLLLIGLAIWGVFWLVRRAGGINNLSARLRAITETPLQILQKRFAQGEIDAEQYAAMKAKLTEE